MYAALCTPERKREGLFCSSWVYHMPFPYTHEGEEAFVVHVRCLHAQKHGGVILFTLTPFWFYIVVIYDVICTEESKGGVSYVDVGSMPLFARTKARRAWCAG